MEESQTSPETSATETVVDSGPAETVDTTAEATTSATADAAANQGESPTPSGLVAESQGETANLSEGVNNESERPQPVFDHESWDGNLDSLPDHLKEPVSFLHRQLESGYTKKFQALADERKAFDAMQTEAKESSTVWADEKKTLTDELDLLRRILGGEEDPRLSELTGKHDELTSKFNALQAEYDGYKSFMQEDIARDAQLYAERFRADHAEIFDNDAQRAELVTLLDADWDPEEAVKLVGQPSNVVDLATELKKSGVKPELALEHAFLKLGAVNAPRPPRPGARMTSGAESSNNPESIRKDITHTNNNREARSMAAKAAMEWQARNRVS